MRSMEYRMTSACFHEHCHPKPVWALASVAKLRAAKQMDGICDFRIRSHCSLQEQNFSLCVCVCCPLKHLDKLITV